MRGVISTLLILFVATATPGADRSTERYNQGNAHYRAGNYAAAVAAYEEAIAHGIVHGDVYFNLGNAYFKNGELGRAILSYERARKLMPDDEDVQANLDFVNALRTDRDPEADPNVLTRFLWAILTFFSANALAILFSACLFCLGGVICLWLFRPERQFLWVGACAVLLVGLVSFGGMLAFKVHQRSVTEAIITVDSLTGRSGPGDDFLQVFVLHEGTKVVIERSEGKWLLVRLRNGIGGWVPVDALGTI